MAALGRTPLTPNQVTVVGLGLTFLAAGLAAFGQLRWAGVVVTVIGLLLGGWWLYGIVFLLAIVTNITALQRIREVWLQGRAQRLEREREIKAQATASRPAPNQAP